MYTRVLDDANDDITYVPNVRTNSAPDRSGELLN